MKKLIHTIVLISFLHTMSSCQKQTTTLFDKYIYDNKTTQLPYNLHKPNIEQGKEYPLILYFHGAGERGSDNEINLKNGIQNFVNEHNLKHNPCFILVPQCNKQYRWVETDWNALSHSLPTEMSIPMSATMELLFQIIETYPIDVNRIYVTGLSMGGYASWDIITRYPNLFAAAMPICGGGDETKAKNISHIPIWAFHGTNDKVVFPVRSINMVDAINKYGGNAKLTLYENMEHNVWTITYSNQEIIDWLFEQYK